MVVAVEPSRLLLDSSSDMVLPAKLPSRFFEMTVLAQSSPPPPPEPPDPPDLYSVASPMSTASKTHHRFLFPASFQDLNGTKSRNFSNGSRSLLFPSYGGFSFQLPSPKSVSNRRPSAVAEKPSPAKSHMYKAWSSRFSSSRQSCIICWA
ncbi:hypothetical protein AALP_AA6G108900 [Arabis alpina]|uniref:Uncharacterized protein n=1 Tax=Arabis alpina TaxID=50452 RepID=A0A087GNG2_ARAAL|nr:hypothetical protein AALP_AA6G108900 [Arabis alpina]